MADKQPTTPIAPHPSNEAPKRDVISLLLTIGGFGFLVFNSGMAIYRTRDDLWSVLFIGISFLDLTSLFGCLHLLERTRRDDSARRGQLKAAVWGLSALLTVMFSYRVAALMPLPVAILVWTMAAATVGGGFYAFFIYKEGDTVGGAADEKLLK